jgi:hypothetical protein
MTTINEDLDVAVALEAMMTETAGQVYAEKAPTTGERQAEYLAAIKDKDLSQLLELQEKMVSVVDRIVANNIDLENLDTLSAQEAEALMVELIEQKDIEVLLKLRYAMIRAAVFAHIDMDNTARKIAYPEKAPGEIEVPPLGKRFTREGGKMRATFDQAKMAQVLTKEQYDRIYPTVAVPEQVIEAHTEERFDEDALHDMVMADFSLLEKLRAAVVPSGFTPSSFHIRAIQKKNKG